MKKIKFKAYSKSNNKMFDNELLENAADGLYNIAKSKLLEMGYFAQAEDLERGVYLPTKDDDLVFMQYTGLKDMDGVDIYEGDILDYGMYGKFKVVFNKASFKVQKLGFSDGYLYLLESCFLDEIEVIGNIYENPELIG